MLNGFNTATNTTQNKPFVFNPAETTSSKEIKANCPFVIKRGSMDKDIFEPTKPDVNRDSLHKLPNRKIE